MFAKRSLRCVVGIIGFAMVAVSADVTMPSASAQTGSTAQADLEARELAEEGERLLLLAKAALAALPNNPVVASGVERALGRWLDDRNTFVRNHPEYEGTKKKTRTARWLQSVWWRLGSRYRAFFPPEVRPQPKPLLIYPRPIDPFPDLEPKELPGTPDRRPDDDRVEKMGLDNPGGYVICHGAVPGAVGIQRDPDRQVRQSMAKECPHLVGGAGRN
jgi:hypothetical protein